MRTPDSDDLRAKLRETVIERAELMLARPAVIEIIEENGLVLSEVRERLIEDTYRHLAAEAGL